MSERNVIHFPTRAIFIREIPGDGWIVTARGHGWLHGDAQSARADAQWLSDNFSLPLREVSHGQRRRP